MRLRRSIAIKFSSEDLLISTISTTAQVNILVTKHLPEYEGGIVLQLVISGEPLLTRLGVEEMELG